MTTINIIKCNEVIDNWGNIQTYEGQSLFKLLITPVEWSDDQTYIDDNNLLYFIDDLIGKQVQVGTIIFTIQEN